MGQNEPSRAKCRSCGSPRGDDAIELASAAPSPTAPATPAFEPAWRCAACMAANPAGAIRCTRCGSSRSDEPSLSPQGSPVAHAAPSPAPAQPGAVSPAIATAPARRGGATSMIIVAVVAVVGLVLACAITFLAIALFTGR